uniref:Uncharacterized protein n=1 Tax=Hanusia phi TaxID=3032 RepID=A0A7S0HWE9_9CRYP|mmetsp:Transcript_5035/g.11903  ORF Transcript_5035/g.11903 Transcript_5035/m.11903 type:complete len:377 (+) Transcript_5035:74-1204(+)
MKNFHAIIFFLEISILDLLEVGGISVDGRMMARIQAWGSNQYGQLGYDGLDSLIPTSPKIIHNLEPGSIRQLALGGGHSLALDTEGIVWSWGWNAKGQLGRNSHDTESCDALPVGGLPSCHIVSAGHEESFAIDDSHCLWAFGKGRSVAYKVTEHLGLGEEGFQDADGGVFHAAAATIDGSCIFWGKHAVIPDEDAAVRQIGGDTIRWKPPDGSKVVQVACGWKHTVMLDNLGRVWGVGSNKHGQLGRHIERSIPFPKLIGDLNFKEVSKIDAGWSHTVVLYLDHTLSAIGRNNFGQCSAFEGCWDDMCAGSEMVLACRGSKLFAAGWNEHGNLGTGDTENRFCPTQVPVILYSSKLFCAGGGHCAAVTTNQSFTQ